MEKLSLLIKELADKIDLYYIPYYGQFCILTLQNRRNEIKMVPFSGKGTYWSELPKNSFKVKQKDFYYLKELYIESLLRYILEDEFSFNIAILEFLYKPDKENNETCDEYIARTGTWDDVRGVYKPLSDSLPYKKDFFKIEQNIIDYLLPQLDNILVWETNS